MQHSEENINPAAPQTRATEVKPSLAPRGKWDIHPVFREILVILLLTLLIIINIPEITLYAEIPSGGDVNGLVYPQLNFLGNCLKSGIIPFWNPHLFSGTPFFANPHTGAGYLPHWFFYLLFPPDKAFGLDLAFHFLLAGLFTYLLSRRLGMGRSAAFFAGICYMFGQFVVTKMLVTAQFFSLPYIPLLIYAMERIFQKRSLSSLIIGGLAGAFLYLSGYPQTVFIAAFSAVIYLVFRSLSLINHPEPKESVKIGHQFIGNTILGLFTLDMLIWLIGYRFAAPSHTGIINLSGWLAVVMGVLSIAYILLARFSKWNWDFKGLFSSWGFMILAGIAAIGLSAFQWYPALLYQPETVRAGFPQWDYFRIVNFPQMAIAVFHDLFMGGGMGDFTISLYIGTVPILLILGALFLPVKDEQNSRHLKIWAGMGIWSLTLVFFDPMLGFSLYTKLPGIQTFYVLHRFLAVTSLALAVLAGLSLEKFLQWKKENQAIPVRISGFLLIVAAILLLMNTSGFSNGWLRLLPGAILVLLYLLAPGRLFHPYLFTAGVLLLTLFELRPETAGYFNQWNYKSPADIYTSTPALNILRQEKEPFRFFAAEDTTRKEPAFGEERLGRLILPNTASVYGLEDVQGYDPIYKTLYRRYLDHANNLYPQRTPYNDIWHYGALNFEGNQLGDMLNIKYALSETPVTIPGFELVSQEGGYLYKNSKPCPRGWIVHQALVTRQDITGWKWMVDEKLFNPMQTVILMENAGTLKEERSGLIGKTGIRFPSTHSIYLRSFSPAAGNKIQIWVDGKEILEDIPGYAVAVVEPGSGDFEEVRQFRTDISADAAQNMLDYIQSIDTGKIVLAAGMGDAGKFIPEDKWQVFQSIGGRGLALSRDSVLQAHAIVGVKGARAGQAEEIINRPEAEIVLPCSIPARYRYDVQADADAEGLPTQKVLEPSGDTVEFTLYQPNKIACRAYSSLPGFLVLSEIYDDGWSATVDGKPANIYRVNGTLRGIFLPKGRHILQMAYVPEGLGEGLGITLCTILLLLSAIGIKINSLYRIKLQRQWEQGLLKKVSLPPESKP